MDGIKVLQADPTHVYTVFSEQLIDESPDVVQQYLCDVAKAHTDAKGGDESAVFERFDVDFAAAALVRDRARPRVRSRRSSRSSNATRPTPELSTLASRRCTRSRAQATLAAYTDVVGEHRL